MKTKRCLLFSFIIGFKSLILFSLGLFCAFELPSLGLATTYYVATNGNDSYNGFYPAYQNGYDGPFRTIGKAASSVRAGDTVQIRGGTYHETVTFNANGTAASPITITNYNSEAVIIDGEYTLPTGSYYYFLVSVHGDYVTLSRVTIKRSAGALLVLDGDYSCAKSIVGIGSRESGIVAGGNYVLLDNCSMTDNGNGYGIGGQPSWGSAICTVGANTTIQNCTAYENRGEGLNAYSRSSHVTMQDNVAYNNRSYNLYFDSSNGGIARRNIIYQTKPEYHMYGITVGAETGMPSSLLVCNNLVMGCLANFHIDSNVTTLSNVTVAYNTFVNSVGGVSGYTMGIYYRDTVSTYSNSIFENNIVVEEAAGRVPIMVEINHSGLVFSNNCWNKNPAAAAVGTDDMIADPKLAKTGSIGAGLLTSSWFRIMDSSPARYRARVLSQVTDDFQKNLRDSTPDMGAFEFSDGTSPLTASATGASTSGQAPLTVDFEGSAGGGTSPYTYRWTFGDGGTSSSQNPSHTYSSAGSYTATLTVTDNSSGTASTMVDINVTASVPLSAGNVASLTSGQAPLVVNFTGSASGGTSPYTYRWTFGDGGTSSSQNPSHTYSLAGSYTATLTVTDDTATTAKSTVNINVTASVPLSAGNVASLTSGQAPLVVNFTGSAGGGTSPYTYRWTFGDGGTSTSQNPSHTYSSAGSYTATLTVTDNSSGTASTMVDINVTASVPLSAGNVASLTSGQAPLVVNFTGSASGGTSPYTYRWTFGDGGTSSSQNPSHTYSSAGSYTATLTVTDDTATTAKSTVNINVTASVPLSAGNVASLTSGQAPLVVNFTGSASGGTSPYTYRWTFGDGGTSSSQNPSHTYSSAGSYTATLTVTDDTATTAKSTVNINVTVSVPLSAGNVASLTSGQAPLVVNFTGSASGGTSPYTYRWTFGDGGTSTSQNPSHTYSSAGSYTATLTVTDNSSGTASTMVDINVTVSVPLSAGNVASLTSGQAPLVVNFTGSASGGTSPYTYRWTFGDGGTSSSQNPSHTYSSPGTYTATLTVGDNRSSNANARINITVRTLAERDTKRSAKKIPPKKLPS